jgi:TalC/MipB family fructose-6-phosphate aldolase
MEDKRRVLFIDSALTNEIETALSKGFQGVTTNPSLVAKAPKGDEEKSFMDKYINHMKKITSICNKYSNRINPSLSVEVFSLESDKMILQAHEIHDKLDYPNLAIKIPISYKEEDYLKVINRLSESKIKVNATCGFSAIQLELAAQAGARFISLFYNREIDYLNSFPNSNGNGQEKTLEILRSLRKYLDNNSNLECEIILGSIRNHYDITNGWENGADIVTAGFKVCSNIMNHPGTDDSVERFDKDLKEWLKNG